MKALVTGATGFVGRHLRAHLEAEGDDVAGADLNGFDVTDAEAVRNVVRATSPEAVYHLAASSHVGDSWDAPQRVFRTNAEGTLNVLRAAIEFGVARVLVVGSADEYGTVGEGDLPLAEDQPLRPITPYGASKAAAGLLALQAHLGDGLATVRTRSFNHTGPGQSDRFLVPALARRIAEAEMRDEAVVSVGSLDAVRDFTDVRDVVRAYRLLVERGEPGGVYNVCSGVGRAVGDVVDALVALARTELRAEVDPALVRPVEVPALVGDPSRLASATDWSPEIPFERTLADVLEGARAALAG
jgi:GDP-4-dehydro-6-deoxy-D-mannose reductase